MINKTHAQNITVKIKSDYIGKKSFIWYWIGRIEEVASLDKTLALPLINFLWNHTTPWLNCVLPPSRKGKNLRKNIIRVFNSEILEKYYKDLLKSYATIYYPIYLNNHYTYSTAMATQDDWQRRCAIVLSGKIVEMIHLS